MAMDLAAAVRRSAGSARPATARKIGTGGDERSAAGDGWTPKRAAAINMAQRHRREARCRSGLQKSTFGLIGSSELETQGFDDILEYKENHASGRHHHAE